MTDNNYVSIKEAIKLTKKSDSTIRRAIKNYSGSETIVYRGENNALFIERTWLDRFFKLSSGPGDYETATSTGISISTGTDMLNLQKEVIAEQKQTIEHQRTTIDKLQDNLFDKQDKLEVTLVKLSSVEQKLIETTSRNNNSADSDKIQNNKARLDNIFVALVVLAVIGLIVFAVIAL
jgi:hypothetical protein